MSQTNRLNLQQQASKSNRKRSKLYAVKIWHNRANNPKQKYAANTKEKKVRKYYQITISDSNQLSKFMHQIGFSISHKSEKLNSIIKDSNTNVDTIKCAEKLRICRESMGADRTQIAEHKQSLKAYEDEKYMPSRDKLREFTEKLGKQLDKLRNLKNKVEKKPSIKAIEGLIDESDSLERYKRNSRILALRQTISRIQAI